MLIVGEIERDDSIKEGLVGGKNWFYVLLNKEILEKN